MTAAKLMSLTTVLLESVTESMPPNRCSQPMVIFVFNPMVIIFIVISISHNFEIQTVNSNLTLNPIVNSNLNVIFFFLTLNPMVNSNIKVIFFNFKPNGKCKPKSHIYIFLNFKPKGKFQPKGHTQW